MSLCPNSFSKQQLLGLMTGKGSSIGQHCDWNTILFFTFCENDMVCLHFRVYLSILISIYLFVYSAAIPFTNKSCCEFYYIKACNKLTLFACTFCVPMFSIMLEVPHANFVHLMYSLPLKAKSWVSSHGMKAKHY